MDLQPILHLHELISRQGDEVHLFQFRIAHLALVTAGSSLASPVLAAETAIFLNTPAQAGLAPVKFAGQFELKLHLPEGRGLARLLIDAGVAQDDATAAAKLAAGRMGDGKTGCFATVSVERGARGTLSLVRVMLTTDDQRTIIERRGAELAIASESAIAKQPRLI